MINIFETGKESIVRPEYTHGVDFFTNTWSEFKVILNELTEQFGPGEELKFDLKSFRSSEQLNQSYYSGDVAWIWDPQPGRTINEKYKGNSYRIFTSDQAMLTFLMLKYEVVESYKY